MRQLLCSFALLGLVATSSALGGLGCDKDKPKPEEEKKSEPTPVPSNLVFNDFLPQNGGNTNGLGVRDAGIEGGLAEVAPGTGQPGEPAGADPTGGAPPAKMRITEPGSEPRSARKYTFTAGKVDKRLLTIAQSVTQTAGGQTQPGQDLTLKLSLDLTPKQVKPAAALIEAKLTKLDVPGAPPQVAQMLTSMNGLSGTFEATSHGEAGEMAFTGTPQMKNQMAEMVVQALNQAVQLLIAPFPDAPIGVGAKWEIGAPAGEGADQGTKRFVLKEVNAEGGVIDLDIDVKVPKRQTQGPGGRPMSVEVDGKGHYTYQFRFDRMSSKVEGELGIIEKIEAPDQSGRKQQISQAQKVKHLIETPPNK